MPRWIGKAVHQRVEWDLHQVRPFCQAWERHWGRSSPSGCWCWCRDFPLTLPRNDGASVKINIVKPPGLSESGANNASSSCSVVVSPLVSKMCSTNNHTFCFYRECGLGVISRSSRRCWIATFVMYSCTFSTSPWSMLSHPKTNCVSSTAEWIPY